jgi:hypothetical protein
VNSIIILRTVLGTRLTDLLSEIVNDAFLSGRKIENVDRLADDPDSEILVDRLAHLKLTDHEVQKVGRVVTNSDADHPR